MRNVVAAALFLAAAPGHAAELFSSLDSVAVELQAPDAVRRRDAVDKLEAFGPREVQPLLVRALADVDGGVRAHAATLLGRQHIAAAAPALVAALGDPDARLRAAAAEALGLLSDQSPSTESETVAPTTAALERALGDAEHEVREAAVIALGRLPAAGARGAAVALTGRLDDESSGVRQHAAEVLGRLGEARAVIPLLSRLGDPAHEVRIAALAALAALGDLGAVPAMVRMLRDPTDAVRATAATALGRLQAESATPALIEAMQHGQSDELRARAAFALGQLGAKARGPAALAALFAALDRDDLLLTAKEALLKVGAPAVPGLLARLAEARLDRATLYLDLLRDIGDARATPTLLDELGRGRLPEEPIVDALGALLRRGDSRPLVDLVALLSAPSPALRRHAALALRGAVDARATSALAKAVGDSELPVRLMAIAELGRLQARDGFAALSSALAAPDEETAAAAARALGELGDRRAIEPLLVALGRPERRVRRDAGDALARVADLTAAPLLLRAVRTSAPDRRSNAIVALGGLMRRHVDPIARELLFEAAGGSDAAARLAALDALGAMGDASCVGRLARFADSGDTAVRLRALQAIGDSGGGEAAQHLVAVLSSGADPTLRAEAAWGLGKQKRIRDKMAAALVAVLKSPSAALRGNAAAALYRLGRAPAELLPLLDDGDPGVRANSALALAGTATARARIGRLADHDGDAHVRAAARRAVGLGRVAPPPATEWVALDVVDFDGAPLAQARYRLVLGDGLWKAGVTDERGVVREESVPRGACTLVLDDAPAPR